MNNAFSDVPVVILCGGRGITLHTDQRSNKGLVIIHQKPLFSWVLMHYAYYGANDFILATGYQSERFHQALIDTFKAVPEAADAEVYAFTLFNRACRVRLVATPENASTAERLMACKPWLSAAPRFALSYSDSLSDTDLAAEMAFHKEQQRTATLLLAKLPVRFRILGMRHGESLVRAFASRPVIDAAPINGGYYIFTNAVWQDKYGIATSSALENEPLERLATEGQLAAFSDKSNWQCLDAERDCSPLERMAKQYEFGRFP